MDVKYKIKKCFLLKDIAGESVVIARGPYALEFGGVLVLNDSCSLLWKAMNEYCTKEDLCAVLVNEYGIDEQTAAVDVEAFIKKMLEYDLLDRE